jgi:plastocyanin
MKFPRIIVALIALFTVTAAVAACGGDDALSDQEYLQRMDAIDKTTDSRFEAEVFGVEDANAKTGGQAFVNIASDVRDQVDKLKPSDDAKNAHEELVAALGEFVTKGEGAIDELSEDDPVEAFFENDAFDSTRVDNAFCAIQDLADAKNIDADVGCDTGEEGVDPSTLEPVETTEVSIQDFAFDPPHIQVSVGDTVTWTQGTDGAPHTATADDESFDTGNLTDEGESADATFDEAGVFPYFCAIHPEMRGQVTVVE